MKNFLLPQHPLCLGGNLSSQCWCGAACLDCLSTANPWALHPILLPLCPPYLFSEALYLISYFHSLLRCLLSSTCPFLPVLFLKCPFFSSTYYQWSFPNLYAQIFSFYILNLLVYLLFRDSLTSLSSSNCPIISSPKLNSYPSPPSVTYSTSFK